jgi:hypothetical protein
LAAEPSRSSWTWIEFFRMRARGCAPREKSYLKTLDTFFDRFCEQRESRLGMYVKSV